MPDLTDVGVSGALHTGLGFFGLLKAVSAFPPYGWDRHDRRGPDHSVSMFCIRHTGRFRSALYTGSRVSSRRATFDSPDSTACRFGSSLEQPRMAGFSLTMLASVQLV